MDKESSNTKAVNLTKYLISLPDPKKTSLLLAIYGIVLGITMSLIKEGFINNALIKGISNGIFLLVIPAFLTSIACYSFNRKIGFKRIIFISFISTILYSITYLLYVLIPQEISNIILFIAYGIIFAIWYVTLSTIFGFKKSSFIFAIIQLTIFGIFLLTNSLLVITLATTPLGTILKLYLAGAIFFISSYLFLLFVNAPMKRLFGVSSTKAFNLFMEHWMGTSNKLEDLFQDIGEDVITTIGIISFKRKDKIINLISPNIHFGPFGTLGGSKWPYDIANRLKGDNIILHGTATHDFNPAHSKEIDKVIDTINETLNKIKYTDKKARFVYPQHQETKAFSIDTKKNLIIGLTRAPHTTEDLDYGIGESLSNYAEKHRNNAIIFDQHNCETGKVTSFNVGSKTYWNYKKCIEKTLENKNKTYNLKMGYTHEEIEMNNIGSAGIKIINLKLNRNIILIVIDSNGITPIARRKIIHNLLKKYPKSYIEIVTTDTHETNAIKGVVNPINEEQIDKLSKLLNKMIDKSNKDIKPAKMGFAKPQIELRVLGSKNATEIVSTVNSIVAIAKITLPFIILWTIITIIWALTII